MGIAFHACRESQPRNRGLAYVFYVWSVGAKGKCYKRARRFDNAIHNICWDVFSLGMPGRLLAFWTQCLCRDVFLKICNEWIQLIVLAAKCQTAAERNTALQWWCAEAPGRKARAIKWKIPAEDVFPFLIWRKRVLFEAGMAVENTENRRRWENDLIELRELKQTCSFSQPTAFLLCRSQNELTYKLYNCSRDPPIWHAL